MNYLKLMIVLTIPRLFMLLEYWDDTTLHLGQRSSKLHDELWGSEEERQAQFTEINMLTEQLSEHYADEFRDGYMVRPKPWDARWYWRFISPPDEVKIWRVNELHRPLWVGRDGRLYFCWSVDAYGRPTLVRLAKFEERNLSGLKKLSGSLRVAVQYFERKARPWSPPSRIDADN